MMKEQPNLTELAKEMANVICAISEEVLRKREELKQKNLERIKQDIYLAAEENKYGAYKYIKS